jgi:hypothetical protein
MWGTCTSVREKLLNESHRRRFYKAIMTSVTVAYKRFKVGISIVRSTVTVSVKHSK